METTRAWFNCYLLTPCVRSGIDVAIAPEKWAGRASQRTGLPPTRPTSVAFPGVTTFARSGRAVRTSAPIRSDVEVFGTPTVKVSIGARGGWSRLVAVLTARTPRGREIFVSAGGVPTKPGAQSVTINLASQATFLPKGSRLTLTLASSSNAQASASLLYLDLPMAQSARARVGTAVLKLPGLRTLVTR